MDELKAERAAKGLKLNEFNLQAMANKVGNKAEDRFNATFETIIGISNFASKTRFNGDLLCKVKAGKRFVLSYATAKKNKGSGWTAARAAAAAAAAAAAKDDPIPMGPDEFDGNFHTITWRD
uniref:HTH araC/xylS-type domain-containing protein n=1 Tax=Panagrolaimus sp. ES5 TaxID=591445 RepID=A0AC34FSC2_9BILA